MTPRHTVWVLGDQLHRSLPALAAADPSTHRVLMVESAAKVRSKRWHVQRAHFVLTSMRRFADELRTLGFEVDHRPATSLAAGYRAHVAAFSPATVSATEPASIDGRALLERLGVQLTRTTQFLCHPDEFAGWVENHLRTRKTFKMEDFYRWQRVRLGYLLDADGGPEGGRWNFDAENREPPPKDGVNRWPEPMRTPLDDVDRGVLATLADDHTGSTWGAQPDGTWATDRAGALARLAHFVEHVLPVFGPHEDAMTSASWHVGHSLLSPYMNVGLLSPREVCDAVEAAYRAGRVPIASAEGFIRQVIGWREYVWGLYWWWGAAYRHENALEATMPLPPAFRGQAPTRMRCLSITLRDLHDHGYVHHIQRLMVLGNLSLLAGIDPAQVVDWMWSGFIDGAEWVMLPNVVGMALHADGGRMATKPYAAGGAYIDRMSDYCKGCAFDRTKRVGDDACPFTTLYWDFMARHEERFLKNARVAQQVRAAQRLSDLPAVRAHAVTLRHALQSGQL